MTRQRASGNILKLGMSGQSTLKSSLTGESRRHPVRVRAELFDMSGERWIKILKGGVKATIRIPTENDLLVMQHQRNTHCWAEWNDGEWHLIGNIEAERPEYPALL